MTNEWDAVIIGGGAAGLSAAQMLGRSLRRTLVIDAGEPRNRAAAHVHGVLGHDGVDPTRLLESGRVEARRYGVEIVRGAVAALVDDGARLRVVRADGEVDTARVVVIATGVRDDLPAVPGLAEQWGRTVLHCPYCHGWEVAGQRLGVLATSPMSVHQMELVRQLSDDVTAFTAGAEPLGEEALARLTARGVRLVPLPVSEVRTSGSGLVVTTEDGGEHRLDAIFTGGAPVIDVEFAADLALVRTDGPGGPLAVDLLGTTSDPRVFAAGNATAPFGNIPVSMAAGSMAGAGANTALVAQDAACAVAERTAERNAAWEQRYATQERFWSGRVNPSVAAVVEQLEPGTALDIGSGEGGDLVWLAERGWRAVGVDVSATAIARASELARSRGVDVDLRVGDGAEAVDGEFGLVLASFLHSWEPDFPRTQLLRSAADHVAPGGRLLIVSHAAAPPWAHDAQSHPHAHAHVQSPTPTPTPSFLSPEEELALLALDPDQWQPEIVEIRSRTVTDPAGNSGSVDDAVLLLHRVG